MRGFITREVAKLSQAGVYDFIGIVKPAYEIDLKNIQAIFHQPILNVINADMREHRQYFLSKIPYGRRKTNKKLTYENGLYSLRYSGFVGPLVKGLPGQKAIIETQLTENYNFKFVRANCLGPEARIKVLEISQVKCLSEIYNFSFNIFSIWEKSRKA